MILGRNFLTTTGMQLDFKSRVVQWLGHQVLVKEEQTESTTWNALFDILTDELKDEMESYILDAKYEATSAKEVAQQKQLEQILSKYTKLFDGKLGHYPHTRVQLELESNA